MENKSGFKQWNQDSRGRLKANPVKNLEVNVLQHVLKSQS